MIDSNRAVFCVALVALGGALGAVARYLLSRYVDSHLSFGDFPFATLLINVLGCFLIGFLLGLSVKWQLPMQFKLLFVTGFCGSFTTFSTFANETLSLWKSDSLWPMLAYLTLSLWLGISAVWLGFKAGA